MRRELPPESKAIAEAYTVKLAQVPEKLRPLDINYIEYPSANQAEVEAVNEDLKQKLPVWLSVWFEVKSPRTDPYVKKNVSFNERAYGDDFLTDNIIQRFPALPEGAVYNPKTGVWRILGRNGLIDTVEKRTTAILNDWGAYNDRYVSLARNYIRRAVYDERFNTTSPFDESKPELVVFKNGTYNMLTNQMQPHQAKDYVLNNHNYEVDPKNSQAPETDKLLAAMVGDADTFIKEYIGYMFYRSYAPFQKALFLHGEGGEGKSTLIRHIQQDLLGSANCSSVPPDDLAGDGARFNKANLYGKEANIVADIRGGFLANTAILKKLTGGDATSAEFKGVQGFDFYNYAKLLFSANELPKFSDSTDGFRNRLVVIDFINGNTREGHKDFWDHHDMDKVKAETPAFAIECMKLFAVALKKHSMTETESIKAATSQWVADNDHFGEFLSDAAKIDLQDQRGEAVKDVVAEYIAFCQDNNYSDKTSSQTITRKLEKMGIKKKKTTKGFSGKGYVWRYVGLKMSTSYRGYNDFD